jgi:hypothetical protein
MGTNLSQVFISDALTALSGTTFNDSGEAADDVGVWNLGLATPAYASTKLFETSFVPTDANAADPAEATAAQPFWLVNRFQIVQRGTPHFIATPIINAANVKSITYNNHVASTRHAIPTGTLVANIKYNVKFIIRTTPTAYLNYGNTNTGLIDLSGANKAFPLGSFNTTNHKAINIGATGADATAAGAKLVSNIQGSSILSDLFTASNNAGVVTVTARHAGVIFDMIVSNEANDAILANGSTTDFSPGVGNAWQVLGEELQCRAKYGNFNRMYFPQDFTTYTRLTGAYDKITLTYQTNWPTATGIAPAGNLNQVTIYYTNAGTDPSTTATEFDDIFNYAAGTDKSYNWF